MLAYPSRLKLCESYWNDLFSTFGHRVALNHPSSRIWSKPRIGGAHRLLTSQKKRNFIHSARKRAITEPHGSIEPEQGREGASPQRLEDIARLARRTFGDKLPRDFLSEQEYHVYTRLYGAPNEIEVGEELELLTLDTGTEPSDGILKNALLRERADGELEEVDYDDTPHIHRGRSGAFEPQTLQSEGDNIEKDEDLYEGVTASGSDYQEGKADERPSPAASSSSEGYNRPAEGDTDSLGSTSQEEFLSRVEEARARAAARTAERSVQGEQEELEARNVDEADEDYIEEDSAEEEAIVGEGLEEESIPAVAEDEELSENDSKSHPLTLAGRSGTYPSTLQFPRRSFVKPITNVLDLVSNRQLSETAHACFGGPGLPNSTATINRPGLRQRPLALDAFQHFMKDMEGNAFITGVLPGAYASIMNILVEVRKRLGTEWLSSLMSQDDGPRLLDAGSGGAGVLAWRDVLKAEWESTHPARTSSGESPPYGKSTVVTGSTVLRHKASKLLDNTTFIPRLPDYNPARDHPSLEKNNPQPRKQYDVVIASYSLWQLKEDHMRKSQVQNLWSLLDPRGGVLILLEKGIPRGFELIAGARETLLRHHVSSPGSVDVPSPIGDVAENRFGTKERGMIIAPCTNHAKCPMYIEAGRSQGRKDYCHFSQRFIRPPFLQQMLNQRHGNHEDVKFSYVALQRGVDQRQDLEFEQGDAATEAAFTGHESATEDVSDTDNSEQQLPHPLTMPRNVLPPIKRKGHVTLDLCTPSGRIERWTVPRSFSKQAYRDARKAKWGDLWALGAKTRVPRRIRVGKSFRDGEVAGEVARDNDSSVIVADEPKAKMRDKAKKLKTRRKLLLDDE